MSKFPTKDWRSTLAGLALIVLAIICIHTLADLTNHEI